jgi:hypothetical protein
LDKERCKFLIRGRTASKSLLSNSIWPTNLFNFRFMPELFIFSWLINEFVPVVITICVLQYSCSTLNTWIYTCSLLQCPSLGKHLTLAILSYYIHDMDRHGCMLVIWYSKTPSRQTFNPWQYSSSTFKTWMYYVTVNLSVDNNLTLIIFILYIQDMDIYLYFVTVNRSDWSMNGMLLVSRCGLLEEDAVEVFLYYGFRFPLLSWCYISNHFKENDNVIVFSFPFKIFITKSLFIRLQG